MLLHEAAAIADEFDAVITRKKWKGISVVIPTDSVDCCILCSTVREESCCTPRWNPTLEDILADDWMVTRAKGS